MKKYKQLKALMKIIQFKIALLDRLIPDSANNVKSEINTVKEYIKELNTSYKSSKIVDYTSIFVYFAFIVFYIITTINGRLDLICMSFLLIIPNYICLKMTTRKLDKNAADLMLQITKTITRIENQFTS